MIKAGTSEKGVCPDCGKAWVRVTESEQINRTRTSGTNASSEEGTRGRAGELNVKTLGWQPTCKCNQLPVPAVVLDPFIGSGTTAVVAKRLGRNYIGIELNPKYARMAEVSLASMREPEVMKVMMDVENGKQAILKQMREKEKVR
jgi:hypothetical protein